MNTLICVSSSGSGFRNLAMEEVLLDRTRPEDAAVFFYVNRRAVIIGRNQNPWAECDLARMEEDGVQLVRRISGGGAVYHDRGNLNYSFLMGKERYDPDAQTELILSAVRALGIPAERTGRNDLTAAGRKFSGQAFCDMGGRRLHHGTLLVSSELDRLERYLTVDERKLSFKGIRSVRSRVENLSAFCPGLTVPDLLERLKEACRAAYGDCTELPEEALEGPELEERAERHASFGWRLGKTPRFDQELSARFAWGGVQLHLRFLDGRVEDLDVFTDAGDPDLSEKARRCLRGVRYRSEDLAGALRAAGDRCLDDLAEYLTDLRL